MRESSVALAALVVIAAILALGLLHLAGAVFMPLAFALLILALAEPARRWLAARVPVPLAALCTLVLAAGAVTVFFLLAGWGFGLVAQWIIGNAGRFRVFNLESDSLHPHVALAMRMFLDHFNVTWLLKAIQEIAVRLNSMLGLAFLTIIFTALGLFELDEAPGRLRRALGERRGARWNAAAARVAARLRHYMLIRTVASILTGLTVWLFALYAGLELAAAWGGLAFLLNYIPFLGPLIATLFPALFAFVQYESLRAGVGVLLALNFIQVLYGCYLEPRLAGSAFALSPLMVMVAVFFGGWLWGIPGTFIGGPMLVAVATILARPSADAAGLR